MSWGQALCPWIIAEGINFIVKNPSKLSYFKLGIWMAVVAQVHNLTLLMLGPVLLYFAIIGFVKHKNKLVLVKKNRCQYRNFYFIVIECYRWNNCLI
ncbi:hypothetical protein N581_0112390 [Lactobacillus jensenii MD IIE-70(2)]|nr:hypothetical protein N581_0112390 [Lactobacillus jensenii MD IIE-70(2)]